MALILIKPPKVSLNRGRRMQEILKQPQYEPMSLENQVIVIFAGTNGFADNVAVEKMRHGRRTWYAIWRPPILKLAGIFLRTSVSLRILRTKLRAALETFKSTWQ